jgi:cell division protein ZapE
MASRSSIARRLKEVVATKRLVRDPKQEELAAVLQGVYDGHIQQRAATSSNAASVFTPPAWLQRRPPPVKGVYVWGGVGVGKSMVMDILHSVAVEEGKVSTRRCHFHEFMLDIHRRCHTLRLQKSIVSPEGGGSAVEYGGSFVDVPEKLAQMRGARAKGAT